MRPFDSIMNHKIYSGLDSLPSGHASDHITPGCLVLEGGSFRGLYTSGVIDALMQADINLQCTIGVSAGAMNGVNYCGGQIGRAGRINLRYRHDSRYVGIKAVPHNAGVIGFDFVLHEINQSDPWDEAYFHAAKRRLVAVVTNCRTGQPEYLEESNCSDLMQAVRASASMPYVSAMVDVDGKPCLDGGCSVKLPIEWALQEGFEKIVVVRTRKKDFRWSGPANQKRPDRFYHKYPEFAHSLKISNEIYNAHCDRLDVLEREGRIFVIAPSSYIPIGQFEGDMEKLGHMYHLGYDDTENALPELKRYLAR